MLSLARSSGAESASTCPLQHFLGTQSGPSRQESGAHVYL